ncbi:SDR family oxidoreductase [Mesorhizobium sp. M7D.F.Ca.US.005.01.1.1]|uniref:SDR family NAD(P)-dependent oxidoreductase n=1 Tax=Mesorhizobium sp. M7D.F.Ca.US.005.01.1.1 TaxID=2493678 RepID=UPI000F74CA15|nr:SDR family NAD(P)-dependent oxidoreductase [Mesorhizobium sp. M7D.F.Ca.US.005.01.1.1]AZO41649.1 SDR family oxidoreductase [Mesorhizobium sp. M7D.F.Ca.US.005.01.1.1]
MQSQHKTAIVTGAARGIGKACALDLARSGYNIALVDLLENELETTAGEIVALGVEAATFIADVSSHQRAGEVVSQAVARFGGVDFLLNNAGRSAPQGILDISEDEFDRAIAINLKSCFNYIQHTAPHMLEQGGGRIVSMSSLNALSGGVTAAVSRFAYAAAKAGILGMTRALAKELGPNIAINAICPGVIRTEIDTDVTDRADEVIKGIALGRLGCADDVARLVTFLATSQPCFMTGQTLTVDGFQFNV